MKTLGGYGRYNDDPEWIGCPRAKSFMTPCVARDGTLTLSDEGNCIGCNRHPATLLKELVEELTKPDNMERLQKGASDGK